MSKQRITLYVDSELWQAFRVLCLRRKVSASETVEGWIRDELTPERTPAEEMKRGVSPEKPRHEGE